MINPLSFIRKNILALKPYSTARDEFKGGDISVWLDANESPYPNGVNRYPDPHQRELKIKISSLTGADPDTIFLGGAGSDEAIDVTFRVFCEPGHDNVVAITPSYGVYKVAAGVNDIEIREVTLNEDFSLPVDRLLDATDSHTKIIWICSPNNPTGNAFPKDDLLDLAVHFNGMVVIDEAYIDFSTKGSMLQEIAAHPNIIVLRTFSKAWGMAGMRCGMAFASREVMVYYNRVKYPYNMSGVIQKMLLERLELSPSQNIAEILTERARLAAGLEKTACVERVYPSDANFLLVKVDNAKAVYDYLITHGVIVRNRSGMPLCENTLRFTVGTPRENSRVLSLMENYGKTTGIDKKEGSSRTATVHRATAETHIDIEVDLEGNFTSEIDTGLKFFDHMLWQLPHHAGISLKIKCRGDLEVDEHHTMEDVAIALGETLLKSLGDKRGIQRYGFVLPMDESRAMVLIDLGGRIDFQWNVPFTREYVGDTPTEMFKHFFGSLCSAMKCNLHIEACGENNHHIIEGVFKAFARALRQAVRHDASDNSLPSSKGML
ncbi:MAG: histidinol-phosphate transaminase [Clostridiales bacterium]|nr:histidinol-phosphate transaminase [Clostridiales bacterium]